MALVSNNCTQIKLGETCQITITFSPTQNSQYFTNLPLVFAAGATTNTLTVSGVPATLSVATTSFAGGNRKTGIYFSVAGSNTPVFAEVDTGSSLLVVEQSYVGPNIQMTNQQITVAYDQGQNPVTGTLGYGSISIPTTTGQTLIANENTPILVVPDNSLGPDGNEAILGSEMDNQVSAKLFLPYPYNQMMVLDHRGGILTYGKLTVAQIAAFGVVQLNAESPASCTNYNVSTIINSTCWADREIPVNNEISGDPNGTETYNTLFDSGATHSSFQLDPLPSWMSVTGGDLNNTVVATLPTSINAYTLPLTSDNEIKAEQDDSNMVNSGNKVFESYIFLFDQADGVIGLQPT